MCLNVFYTSKSRHLSATVHACSGVEADGRSSTAFLVGPDRFHDYPGVIQCRFIG